MTSELFPKLSGDLRGPKNPSVAIELTSKLCGKHSENRQDQVGAPKNPSQTLRASVQPPRKPSKNRRDIIWVRRPGRSLASSHPTSREPGFDLRKALVLRGAQMHSAVRAVSFLVPLDERPSRIWHPKRPSTVHRPMSELRSRYVDKVQRNVRDPKIPSETRRPTSEPRWSPSVKLRHGFKPRRAHLRTLASHRSASRPSVRLQRPVQAPKSSSATNRLDLQPRVEPSRELPSRVRPPKRPSTKHRLTLRLRGAFRRVSGPRQASEEAINRSSTRFPAPWNLPPSFSTRSGSEEPVHEASACLRDP